MRKEFNIFVYPTFIGSEERCTCILQLSIGSQICSFQCIQRYSAITIRYTYIDLQHIMTISVVYIQMVSYKPNPRQGTWWHHVSVAIVFNKYRYSVDMSHVWTVYRVYIYVINKCTGCKCQCDLAMRHVKEGFMYFTRFSGHWTQMTSPKRLLLLAMLLLEETKLTWRKVWLNRSKNRAKWWSSVVMWWLLRQLVPYHHT